MMGMKEFSIATVFATVMGSVGCAGPSGPTYSESPDGKSGERTPITYADMNCTIVSHSRGKVDGVYYEWEKGAARQTCVARTGNDTSPVREFNKDMRDVGQTVRGVGQTAAGVGQAARILDGVAQTFKRLFP